MKKKEFYILREGFLNFTDNKIGLYGKQFAYIKLKHPSSSKIWCYCKKGCSCKPWKLVIER